jgi:hypothetical protein
VKELSLPGFIAAAGHVLARFLAGQYTRQPDHPHENGERDADREDESENGHNRTL